MSQRDTLLRPEHIPWRTPSVIGIGCALVATWLFIYRGALEGVFHFDDFGNIVDNERIRSLWPLNPFLQNNRPVGLYSFAINYHIFGSDPYSYHVVNVSIHLLNGLLLFFGCLLTHRIWHGLIERPCAGRGTALLMASLISSMWVIHPITTQAVTNVVQRYEALTSMGYLGVWVGLLLILNQKPVIGTGMVVGMSWLGLMSKEVFAMAPFVVLMFDRWLTEERWRRILRRRGYAYGLMFTPYLWFVPMVSRFFDPVRSANSSMGIGMRQISAWEYLRTQPEVIWHYLSLVIWPKNLCFDYLWRIQNNPLVYLSLGLGLLACLGGATWAYCRSISQPTPMGRFDKRCGFAGWLTVSFFFVLAPTSSFMPIADMAVEHRMYLASAFVIAGVVMASRVTLERLLKHSTNPRVLKLGVSMIVAGCFLLLAWRTHVRNLDYQDGLRLWSGAARIAPENPRAWYNIGRELYNRGDRDGALRPMLSSVGLSSAVPIFDVGLADCLRHRGRMEDAVTLYRRAIKNNPNYGDAYNSLGAIYLARREFGTAEECLTRAVEVGQPEARYNLATLYLEVGRYREALPLLEETLATQPEFHRAARRLAWILATASDAELRDIERAADLMAAHYVVEQSTNPYVLDTYAVIEAARGRFDLAKEYGTRALRAAEEKSDKAFSEEIRRRLASFERGEPWCAGGVQ